MQRVVQQVEGARVVGLALALPEEAAAFQREVAAAEGSVGAVVADWAHVEEGFGRQDNIHHH